MSLVGRLFRWEALEALLGDRVQLQGLLDFEAALARAEARAGVIPAAAMPAIAGACRADRFEVDAIARGAALAGNPAIPVVRILTSLVEKDDPEAARFVHWGATSQDAMDTALVLQLRPALQAVQGELDRLAGVLARLAGLHRATPVAGRTWMQQAAPTSFGLKVAGWLDAVERHRARLRELRARALVLQFGGAVGTLAALGHKGADVAAALADELELSLPDVPWHAHRDRLAEVATTLGLAGGTLGKIARDVSLHAQTEVGELSEPEAEGRGTSSTLPHKRNPVASAVALAAADRIPGLAATMLAAMVQEDERGLGGWHAEWEVLPELVSVFGGALHHLTDALAGLRVDAARMEANLEVTRGLVFAEAVQMALAARTGRASAQRLVAAACERARAEGRHLRDVLAADPETGPLLPGDAIAHLFDPRRYLGVADAYIDRVLTAHSDVPAKPDGS